MDHLVGRAEDRRLSSSDEGKETAPALSIKSFFGGLGGRGGGVVHAYDYAQPS